jgi:hypothetical protein
MERAGDGGALEKYIDLENLDVSAQRWSSPRVENTVAAWAANESSSKETLRGE